MNRANLERGKALVKQKGKNGFPAVLLILFLSLFLSFSLGEEAEKWDGVLSGYTFSDAHESGFHIPLPQGDIWNGSSAQGFRGLFAEATGTDSKSNILTYQAFCQSLNEFAENDEEAERYYDSLAVSHLRNVVMDRVQIDGHPARLITFSYDDSEGLFQANGGILLYAREMRLLQIRVYAERENRRERKTPRITLADLRHLAEMIRFVPEEAPIRLADVQISIVTDRDRVAIPAAGKLQLTAQYGNASIAESIRPNDVIDWSVTDMETGGISDLVSISEKGLLTAVKDIPWMRTIRVTASSQNWKTTAYRDLTVMPSATSISVQPSSLTFFAGETRSENLIAMLEPDYLPALDISWSVNKKDLIEIEDHGNGVATVRPLSVGKGTMTVKEPGGKSFAVSVTVLRPVTELAISRKGQTYPGSTLIYSVKLTPYNPGDRTVTWAVDVGEEIASITQRGHLKISKDAPEGTVIHVTCTSNCAIEPVVVTDEVIVKAK